jgi:nucleoid DNA-binding protein
MTKQSPAKPKRSDMTRQKMRDAAVNRHSMNAERVRERVTLMLTAIEEEISENHGIYPANKGTLSLAEIARRAEIHPLTFHKPNYRMLAKHVRDWLFRLKAKPVTKKIRKGLAGRVQDWQQLYDDLLESHRVSETDLSIAKEELKLGEEELRKAYAEIDRLKAELASFGNVVRLPSKSNA